MSDFSVTCCSLWGGCSLIWRDGPDVLQWPHQGLRAVPGTEGCEGPASLMTWLESRIPGFCVGCCYQELKSPKPQLDFFLATGAAVLVDGSSSATRFVAAGLMYLPTP